MSNISDFNTASNAETDREHQVQLGLLQALCTAARENQDTASLGVILDQLIAYSEAHFMSEELLMRLYAYPDYDDHVNEHEQMLDALDELTEGPAIEALSALLLRHIGDRDAKLHHYLASL